MKSGKLDDILDRIDSLPNWQAFLCCRTLVVLLDRQLAADAASRRPRGVVITDFDQFGQLGDIETKRWYTTLATARRPVLARLGRFLMSMCLNRGYAQAVIAACGTAQAPVAHLGDLTPARIVGALGVVMSWMPGGQTIALPQIELFQQAHKTHGWPSREPYAAPLPDPITQKT